MNSHEKPHKNGFSETGDDLPPVCQRLPWETPAEHTKFHYFLLCGPKRSVRRAYRLYCEASGIKPKKDPPSSWYQLYRGEYLAIRRAGQKAKAIKRAVEVHKRQADWERLAGIAALETEKQPPEYAEIMFELTLIDLTFDALAIDIDGDPIPGAHTWDERKAAYEAAHRL